MDEKDIIKKYGKILENDKNIFLVDIKGDVDEAIEKIEEKLAEYTLSVIKRDGKKIKFKIEKDLFKRFLNQIKKYKEGLVPEDISKEEDE